MCNLPFSELRHLEVINICTGCRLGYVCDVELDMTCGKVTALIVPGNQPFFCLKKQKELRIPFDCINKISEDIILVTNAFPICTDQ